MERPKLSGKKILFILPPRRFRDEEYLKPKLLFDEAGAQVTVASSSLARATGILGAVVSPDRLIKDVRASDFDAVVLVGGVGCNAYWHDETVHTLVKESHRAARIVSAICLAPVTLANAGLLEGKPATAYPSAENYLRWKGATYTGSSVEVAENIVTARGPEAAEEFALTVAKLLAAK